MVCNGRWNCAQPCGADDFIVSYLFVCHICCCADAAIFVASAPCAVSADTACFRSPNYPYAYNSSQQCTIQANQNVQLSVSAFSTEADYDFLTVNGVQYSGDGVNRGPVGVSVAALTSNITWESDGSVVSTGFEICAVGKPRLAPCQCSLYLRKPVWCPAV